MILLIDRELIVTPDADVFNKKIVQYTKLIFIKVFFRKMQKYFPRTQNYLSD